MTNDVEHFSCAHLSSLSLVKCLLIYFRKLFVLLFALRSLFVLDINHLLMVRYIICNIFFQSMLYFCLLLSKIINFFLKCVRVFFVCFLWIMILALSTRSLSNLKIQIGFPSFLTRGFLVLVVRIKSRICFNY